MANSFLKSTIRKEFESSVDSIMAFLQKELRKELSEQGHKLTGKLIDSVEYEIRVIATGIQAGMYLEDYYVYLEKGVNKNKIPYNPGSGKKVSKYIQGLIRFWQLRGLGEKEAKRAAFATANKHKQEGMPTRNSYNYSKNGRRLGFTQYVLDEHLNNIEKLFEKKFDNTVTTTFINMLDKNVKVFGS